ncbi:MAG: hypothetical protein K8T26_11045 [Lentisphaerae bacterium]|nr:hypothetical protein [Lentisphaerota bacterium]
MIAESEVDVVFRQSFGSCVLSSYGIVAHYFTRRPVTDVFHAYCRAFGLNHSTGLQAEQNHAAHFDTEWRNRGCMGYEVILDLHNNSNLPVFKDCRDRFTGRFILDSATVHGHLAVELKSSSALLNLTYEPGGDYHSVTIFHNGTELRERNTNSNTLRNVASLDSLGALRDAILFTEK